MGVFSTKWAWLQIFRARYARIWTNRTPPIGNPGSAPVIASKSEQTELDALLDDTLAYMVYKNTITDSMPDKLGKSLQGFLETLDSSQNPQSNVVYIDILDEHADTILHTLAVLQDKLQVGTRLKVLGVIGDGKTYDHLHALKIENGADLNWLIPLPGNWNILKNYQQVLMKVYLTLEWEM